MRSARSRGATLRSLFGWSGLAALVLGVAAYAALVGIARHRLQAIIDNPCEKDALGPSALETALPTVAAIGLFAALACFVVVLVSGARQQTRTTATRLAWIGLVIGVLLSIPVANIVAGDPLGFDDQMLPDCMTMSSFIGMPSTNV